MATDAAVAQLRLIVAEPDDAAPYTDSHLKERLDADGNLNTTAFKIWTEKAARAAELVDITEGGSTRKMGDMYEQALGMARHHAGLIVEEPAASRGTRVVKLTRP